MFTGLVRAMGKVLGLTPRGGGRCLRLEVGELAADLEPGASLAVAGVCLTVTAMRGAEAVFDMAEETVGRTTLGRLRAGDRVNLEPSLRAGEPLDGHLVLGHVDAVGYVREIRLLPASRLMRLSLPAAIRSLVAAKGSIAADGVSLTVVAAGDDDFSVSVIPHTAAVTTLGNLRVGSPVNLEADVVARYLDRLVRQAGRGAGNIPR